MTPKFLFLTCIAILESSKFFADASSSHNLPRRPFMSNSGADLFGDHAKTFLNIRGGEVLEPKSQEEIEDILLSASATKKLVVIDFSATWCGPCKMIAPLYHELSEMPENQDIVFLKVDVDENSETAMKYSVSAMPTFLFIKEGEVIERLMGANPGKLQEMLEELK